MYRFWKRFFDLLLSFILIIIFLIPMILIALLVSCTSKGGPLFIDHRVGKGGKEIKVLKFRTMKKDNRKLSEILSPEEYEEFMKNRKLKNDPRVTKVGRVLRKLSLDELPQLFNIFVGNMSFVGPRPLYITEIDILTPKQKEKYVSVKGGLTSYWAVNGRNSTTYEDRIKKELYYVDHASLGLDFKVFFKTFICFFKDSY